MLLIYSLVLMHPEAILPYADIRPVFPNQILSHIPANNPNLHKIPIVTPKLDECPSNSLTLPSKDTFY